MTVKQPKLTAYAEEEFVDRAAEMKASSKLVNDNSATQITSGFMHSQMHVIGNPIKQHMYAIKKRTI